MIDPNSFDPGPFEQWFSTEEVARLFEVPPGTLAETLTVAGDFFATTMVEGAVYYRGDDVYAFLSLLVYARRIGYDPEVHAAGVEAILAKAALKS